MNLDDGELGTLLVARMKSTRSVTRFFSWSTFPGLSRLVAMAMNGPVTAPPYQCVRKPARYLAVSSWAPSPSRARNGRSPGVGGRPRKEVERLERERAALLDSSCIGWPLL